MKEVESNNLFDRKFIDLIRRARELNEDGKIFGYIYFNPGKNQGKIKIKTIDLNSKTPLCEVNSRPSGQDWEERWVEAYLINRAKENKWRLERDKKTYRFLASQFTFQRQHGWTGPKHVDLLLYDEQNKNLIVLELKADSQSFPTAKEELQSYGSELIRLFKVDEDEKAGALNAYKLEEVKDVIGYIVYPSKKAMPAIKPEDYNKYDPFGLIEYDKPWVDNFDLVKELGRTMQMEFRCVKPGKIIEDRH